MGLVSVDYFGVGIAFATSSFLGRNYISVFGRYVPSQADVAVFEAVSGPPPADLCHALRWYNHIKSYEKEKAR